MNLQSILGISLAGVSLVCGIGFFLHHPTVQKSNPDLPSLPRSYTEPMPESSDESYRIHVLGADGAETEICIKYKDKSDGTLILGANGKTVQERRTFADGSNRKEARFDENGVLLSGFEFRNDKTLLWQTALAAGQSKTFTRVFWPDGKLFLDRVYDIDTKVSDSAFWRDDGVLWQKSQYQGAQLISLSSYDEAGHLRVLEKGVVKTGAEKGDPVTFGSDQSAPILQVVYFNEDGMPDFGQWVGYTAQYYYDASSGEPNPNPLFITGIDVYAEGKLSKQYQLFKDHRLKIIDEIQPDGAIKRHYVQHNGFITEEDFVTATGVSTQFDFDGRFGKAPPLDERFLVPLPDNDVPFRRFNEQEARLSEDVQ